MSAGKKTGSYGLYWRIWFILLIVTLVMVFIDRPTAQALQGSEPMFPQGVLIFILVSAMLLKALLIGSYFMHLRFERVAISLAVLVGLLINGAILFFLIVPDACRILGMTSG